MMELQTVQSTDAVFGKDHLILLGKGPFHLGSYFVIVVDYENFWFVHGF